jgi:hypothetical protein
MPFHNSLYLDSLPVPSTRRPQPPRIQSPRYSVQRLNARRADLEYDGYQPGQSDAPGVGELLRGGALQ